MTGIMKNFLSQTLAVLFLCGLTVIAVNAQGPDNSRLTNAAVVKLVRAGFKEKTVISIIATRPPSFDLSPDHMIELKRSGVSEKIILAMLARQEGANLDDEIWIDDPVLSQNPGKQKDNQKGSAENSTEIFGSSGGTQGSNKTRSGNSSSSGDTLTTGSATVRIIRPPAEGAAPPKLEKTATLTNDSIIDLVEAGFSDGTIIRRIEQSPVEFDFSAAKLSELRKHRVSDKILAAMRAAMGSDSNSSQPGSNPNGTRKQE